MSVLALTFFLLIGSMVAGLVGALTGLGGGVLLVPMLVLLFHVDVHYAVGASLISVIATSSGASAAYIREGYTNLRIATFLLVATVAGALVGAVLAEHLHGRIIAIIFGVVLIFSAYLSLRRQEDLGNGRPSSLLALRLGMEGSLPTVEGWQPYRVYNVMGGFGLMLVAGTLSGLLGIGSGAVKVLAMDQVMRLPYKVSTTTSNFMIGVTAAASAGVYMTRGFIDPGLTMPVMIGVFLGAVVGAKFLMVAKTELLRIFFSLIVFILAVEMIYSGLTGKI
ncbi:predicted permease protein (dsrJOP associated) [Candidatus Sulfotelmatobacter sp. SbA7]|nr:predicted permease protein (dsrJOP associated) [Candidatus Sulfotelmatobacter sp. SbA7]